MSAAAFSDNRSSSFCNHVGRKAHPGFRGSGWVWRQVPRKGSRLSGDAGGICHISSCGCDPKLIAEGGDD